MKAVYLEEGAVNRGDISLEPITSLIETKVYKNTTEADKYEHIGDAEIVFGNKIIFDEEAFTRLPNLKYIGVCATGYNVVDLEAAKRHGVRVTNVPAYSTESVAQLTWGFILECASHIEEHNRSVHNGDWVRSDTFCYWLSPVMELDGKTIGIVGYGNIGKRVAEIALAFRMKVLVYTAHPEKYAGEDSRIEFTSLDDVIIINVSRGGLVNEADLAEALRSGRVAAAAADVVTAEPMKEDNPLLTAPNMCITPHIAWASVEARRRLIQVIADNVQAFLEGREENVLV